ncbi:MAG: DoxX family protein [Flavobacteriales bacterium]
MKRDRIIYWAVTVLLAVQLVIAGILYFTDAGVSAGFAHLGFPDHLRMELGVAKLIAAVVILLPRAPHRLKEWAYAGLGITFVSAFIAHSVVDGPATGIAPLFSLVLLVVSYIYLIKLGPVRGDVRTA